MTEEWKPIPGYEGLYDASNWGRIRSHPGREIQLRKDRRPFRRKGVVLQPCQNGERGDYFVGLRKDGVAHTLSIARLVAMAWHGVPQDGMEVDHINGVFVDNRAENLEWVTRRENMVRSMEIGLRPTITRPTMLVDENGISAEFRTMSDASRFLHRSKGYIKCCYQRKMNVCSSYDGKQYKIVFGGE